MMEDRVKLVERLNAYRPSNHFGALVQHKICDEAATQITRLSEQNDRLREALGRALDIIEMKIPLGAERIQAMRQALATQEDGNG